MYYDRLYLNNGKGKFSPTKGKMPNASVSGSCVKPFDFDGDGDLDLFIGGRHVPHNYPSPAPSRILENKGGQFVKLDNNRAPNFSKLGMVTDAVWTDFDSDGSTDLLVVGEWMPITVFLNKDGSFVKHENSNLPNSKGWWNAISSCDIDNDGDEDFVIGNLGLNYKYQASPEEPFHVYANDFDSNGSFDIALGYIDQNQIYPVRGRQCSSEQMPSLSKKFPTYTAFASASIEDVYGKQVLDGALHFEVNNFNTSILMNDGNGNYSLHALPHEAQVSPVNAIICQDFNQDGNVDLLLGGNLYVSEVETGRADAGTGLLLFGDGKGDFKSMPYEKSGFYIPGDVKDLSLILQANKPTPSILVTNNNAAIQLFEYREQTVVN